MGKSKKTSNSRMTIVFDIDRVLFDTKKFTKSGYTEYKIYSEDEGAIKKLKKMGKIAIFSQIAKGSTFNFQVDKLFKTGLNNYFDKNDINIHKEKISELKNILDKYKGLVILVDDLLDVLKEAKKISDKLAKKDLRFYTVWVKRGKHALKADKSSVFSPDLTILNLNELVKHLQEKYALKIE